MHQPNSPKYNKQQVHSLSLSLSLSLSTTNMAISTNHVTSLSKPCISSFTTLKVLSKPNNYFHLGRSEFKRSSISCNVTTEASTLTINAKENDFKTLQRPDSVGRFGKFGGKYVPETLIPALTELEAAFHAIAVDQDFQV